MRFVGIDVGGTAIKGGAVDAQGTRLAEASCPTDDDRGTAAVLERIAGLARELGAVEAGGLGFGVPGLLEQDPVRLESSPNLRSLVGAALEEEIARRLELDPRRVVGLNDANAAALGEAWLGGMRGARHGLMVTLGTGVGGGLVLDGDVFVGHGMAGEIGHVTIEPGGLPCGCGSLGCLETLASATAAARRAREVGLPPERPGDVVLLTERARAGARAERELLHAIGTDLGRGLGAVVSLLDVRWFVFGGGFAAALDVLEPGIRAGLASATFGRRLDEVRLERATLGTSAGWIGAARAALTRIVSAPES